MMADMVEKATTNELPKPLRWFAPWTWSRNIRLALVTLITLTPFVYVLAEAPVNYLLVRTRLSETYPKAWYIRNVIFLPLDLAIRVYSPLGDLYSFEFKMITATFGPARPDFIQNLRTD